MPNTNWRFFLTECWISIRRHRTATFTTLLQCISSLTVLGICMAFIINANHITLSFLNSLEMVAFLEDDVTTAEADQLQIQLTKVPGIASIRYVSKEQAYSNAQEILAFEVSEMLGEGNPFPASFEIRATHAKALETVGAYLQGIQGIEEVKGPGEFSTVLPVMFFIQAACFFLTLILAGTTLFTIKNTIQLAILARRTEIRVMQLVGATPAFVRIPFLLEGLAYGLIGAAVAWITVTGAYAGIHAWLIEQNPLVVLARLSTVAFNEFIVLATVGLLVGFLGALVSVDRHLNEKYAHSSAIPAMAGGRRGGTGLGAGRTAVLLLLLLTFCMPLRAVSVSAQTGDDSGKPSEAEIAAIEAAKADEIADIEAEKQATKAKLSAKRREKKNVLGELNVIDNDLIRARSRLGSLQSQLQQQQEELARTRAQHDRYQTEYTTAQRRLGNRLRLWYKSQDTPLISMFFTSAGLNEFSYKLRYAESALSADRSTINFIRDQHTLLEESDAAVNRELERTEQLAKEVDGERATFQNLRNTKAGVLSDLNADVRSLERAYAQLEQSSREIEWFLASLKGGGSILFEGTFIHPLPGYRQSSPFGYRHHPILKRRKLHTGLDIAAPSGTPIRAAAAGTVVFAGWKNGYGKCVIIQHGQGFATLYGHMSSISLKVGQDISQGIKVGGVGTTGMSTGNHLHFEIRVNGKPIDPHKYV